MADGIRMTFDELTDSATNIDGNKQTVVDTLVALDNTINQLMTGWESAAQSSFLQEYGELKKDLNRFPDILEGLSSQIKEYVRVMRETDAAMANAFKGQ